MPNAEGRFELADIEAALLPAEQNICGFKPPTAPPEPPPPDPNVPVMVAAYAAKSAQERALAIFAFLDNFIRQGANDAIAQQNLVERLDALEARIAALE